MTLQTIEPTAITALTPGERRHLQALEKRIERGMQTFKEVGASLQEVRDSRLYRETHTSFESYCHERWGLERQRAYQLIGANEVIEALPAETSGLVRNEATARELVTVMREDPEALTTLWQRVTEEATTDGKPITAETVRRVKAEVLAPRVVPVEDLMRRLLTEASRIKALYSQWIAEGPDRKAKRNVDSAIRAITQV
jgi:hypothetical protein